MEFVVVVVVCVSLFFFHVINRCIDDTCLEGIVECVAENCAIPLYKFMGQTCCRICCSEGAAENVDNARTVSEDSRFQCLLFSV